jgi:DUF4097 and DUF4098 domain-containing protein YvlB
VKTRRINAGWAVISAIGLAALLAAASSADARKVEYMEEISRVIEVDPDVTLILHNTSGETEITTWGQNEIRILATKAVRARSADEAREYAEDLEIEIRKDGTRLVEVETRYPDWGGGGGVLDFLLSKSPTGEVDYEVTVPTKATIQVHASSGDVTVEETGGDLTVSVTSADVNISEIKGRLVVNATSGDIEVDDVRGESELSATTGDVTVVGVRGGLLVGVTSGDIYCQDVEGVMELGGSSSSISVLDCRGNLTVLTSSGDIEVGDHRGGVVVRTSDGYVEIEVESLEGGECDISTSSGDVELELSDEGSYQFIIDTVSGDIDVTMPEEMQVIASRNSLQAKYRGGKLKVMISTITGDIYIEGI